MPPIDKTAHFLAGAALAALPAAYGFPYWSGFALACVAAAAKELYDLTGRGTPDVRDFIVTVVGAATVLPLGVM
jgi:hypothetical protein